MNFRKSFKLSRLLIELVFCVIFVLVNINCNGNHIVIEKSFFFLITFYIFKTSIEVNFVEILPLEILYFRIIRRLARKLKNCKNVFADCYL